MKNDLGFLSWIANFNLGTKKIVEAEKEVNKNNIKKK